ncbi:MAG: hypothetical protein A2900_01120 [Candidatus Chisholmbacteria bacterium RIFCSPLOWO2_01_FULL_50_28]|uniref:SH3b domain-containing protein n=1 Tax=Candidatus Chisholmbacteria bacterium RIFCSPHIGHO2_01_FULL_52_32 TaxID=1797591 RepID=A0A1G1VUK0_9BACT|nr:MAG: hypothetical protein A2786_06180 [Candidatus Chisholmbacteria bacterium RIFCSPHIGHO2_01_FULL_52_32]OGY19690.1 MAG: hypothetical protein A2900_01120 [Candidatus Chisholmbacteria bacterium RIFCSPLOWO2_01_FULL_50_28]
MARKLLFLGIIGLILAGCSLPSLRKANAALQITTNAKADVFVDGEKIGETPLKNEKLQAKEYTVRLVPKEGEAEPWEVKVTLEEKTTTAISYDFGSGQDTSSGSILSLEPLVNKKAVEVTVVSIPDNASVNFDGQPKGFTPLQVKDASAGDHTLAVQAPGYSRRQVEVKTVEGYRLTVEVHLAKEMLTIEESSPSAQPLTPTPTPTGAKTDKQTKAPTTTTEKPASPSATPERPYVEILDTPTGWLRVRSSPSTSEDNEIARVNPKETYPYVESNDAGWIKIRLPDGKTGWISGRYAKIYK